MIMSEGGTRHVTICRTGVSVTMLILFILWNMYGSVLELAHLKLGTLLKNGNNLPLNFLFFCQFCGCPLQNTALSNRGAFFYRGSREIGFIDYNEMPIWISDIAQWRNLVLKVHEIALDFSHSVSSYLSMSEFLCFTGRKFWTKIHHCALENLIYIQLNLAHMWSSAHVRRWHFTKIQALEAVQSVFSHFIAIEVTFSKLLEQSFGFLSRLGSAADQPQIHPNPCNF